MPRDIVTVISGDLLDDGHEITLAQLCRACTARTEIVVALVREGILAPRGEDERGWRFPAASIGRTRTVLRLQRDLEINLAGVAVVLDLLDRIARLESKLGE